MYTLKRYKLNIGRVTYAGHDRGYVDKINKSVK